MDSVLEIKRRPSEYIRGIAIVFVVLGHILGGTFGMIDTHITSILGIGGVTIFLLLSGYGLYQSYQKSGLQGSAYWDKKLKRFSALRRYYRDLLSVHDAPWYCTGLHGTAA